MPNLLQIEEYCKDLKEVTSLKVANRKKFHPEGLFSEQIFGPVRNYTCQCGTYHGASNSGKTCKDCGVDIVNSRERRRRFAKIVLPIPVVNPIFYDLVITYGGNEIKKPLTLLMTNEQSVLYVNRTTNEHFVTTENNEKYSNSTFKSYEKSDAIKELIKWLADDLQDTYQWKFIKENLDKLLINEVIVLPPDLRPVSKVNNKDGQVATDKINRYYVQILTKKESMRNTLIDIHRQKSLYYSYFRQLQKDVFELYEHIIAKLSKKEGLIRGSILGKRIDFSGRAVIAPEPMLKIDECSLPYFMVLELFKLQIARRLTEMEKFKLTNEAIEFVDSLIELSDYRLLKLCEEITKDEVCLLNRQPSLHRLGLVGFNIKVNKENTIKIHPLVCAGFNADFDGDQMAVYIPISKEAKSEVREKFLASKNFFNASNGWLSTTPSQDIVLGIYILTNNMIPDYSEKIEYKNEMVSKGIKIFNECLPETYPLINKSVNSKELISILNNISRNYPQEETSKTLDMIKEVGFKYSTLYGVSLSLDNMKIPGIDDFKNNMYSKENIREQLEIISSKDTEKLLKENFKYSYLIDSGARGKWDQARQIVMTRGYVSNFNGEILSTPIKGNLIDGLTQEEFFNSTYGCRKGLLDVAVNTGSSGYLSRKLIFSCANLMKSCDLEDCGTKDYLPVYVGNEKKARMLEFRYYLNPETKKEEIITLENCKNLIGKHIYLRSPIYCKSERICHKCYGDIHKKIHSKFIGIIAAQALGEVGTQLVLRVFHTSGVAQIKGGDKEENNEMKQMDIIGDLSTSSKLLHVKDKNVNAEELTSSLFDVYSSSKEIQHVHFEVIVAQLMWVGGRKWRLLPSREQVQPKFHSIQSVPETESWILGLGFSNPKKNILRGLLYKGNYRGILDDILLGKKL